MGVAGMDGWMVGRSRDGWVGVAGMEGWVEGWMGASLKRFGFQVTWWGDVSEEVLDLAEDRNYQVRGVGMRGGGGFSFLVTQRTATSRCGARQWGAGI